MAFKLCSVLQKSLRTSIAKLFVLNTNQHNKRGIYMEIVLVLAVILGIAFFIMRKRQAEKANLKVAGSDDLAKPLAVAPKPASKRLDTASQQAKPPVAEAVEKTSKPAEVQAPAQVTPVSASSSNKQQEQIPEDSTLRRHYLSARQAEKEAKIHPYPTDSVLRRHYESMRALSLKPAAVVSEENFRKPATVCVEKSSKLATKPALPEDSTLRRHVLTQVRAEIESQLCSRPTDSTLRRHYDSQVEAKMEEYLAQFVA
ncbi:MAG: hypothetical protein ACXV7J_03585 [Methylomonas sp.]